MTNYNRKDIMKIEPITAIDGYYYDTKYEQMYKHNKNKRKKQFDEYIKQELNVDDESVDK